MPRAPQLLGIITEEEREEAEEMEIQHTEPEVSKSVSVSFETRMQNSQHEEEMLRLLPMSTWVEGQRRLIEIDNEFKQRIEEENKMMQEKLNKLHKLASELIELFYQDQ